MWIGGVISNVHSLGTKLLHAVNQFSSEPSSSSSPASESHQIETELKNLMDLLMRIKATLNDAEEREIRDESVKLWLKELKRVAYDAEDVLDEYNYEVLRAQVEARNAFLKGKLIQIPYGMLGQIQQIKTQFAEIAQHRIALQLSEEEAPRRRHRDLQVVPTSHMVVESNIIGRQREKEELINLLCSENHDGKIISVVTIVGAGGIGKTTLAQLVYNDKRIQQKFDKFGWVCVSEDFNVQKHTKEVIESITRKPCTLENLSALQHNISEGVRKKRIFLVLDDVWNEKRNLWETFRVPFMQASMVKILVTTRNESVARIMQTIPTFNLDYMSEDQSWQLFQRYEFGEVIHIIDSNLVKIGKQILKKCGRLPLAVKSIACLIRHEPNEKSWREILESELWESDARSEIFQPLQISYARLPTYLKPCFLYCSMFPKDYRYDAKELVNLWISQGYVQNSISKDAKKVGLEYAKQLLHRSLFQGSLKSDNFQFTLHHMVHDLARSISGHGCCSTKGDIIDLDFCEEFHHLYIGSSEKLLECPSPPPSKKFATLRTLFVNDYFWSVRLVSEVQKLRALKLVGNVFLQNYPFNSKYVRSSVDQVDFCVNLKHLRYLSLYQVDFKKIHIDMCSIFNLQNLNLRYCENLTELPQCIGDLISLEELTIIRCKQLRVLPASLCQLKALKKLTLGFCSVKELPHDIGNLTNLQLLTIKYTKVSHLPSSLNKMIRKIQALDVSLECSTMEWLEHFIDLDGTLIISCDKSHNLEDVRCAKLASMHNLQCLILSWDSCASHASHEGKVVSINYFREKSFEKHLENNLLMLMDCLQPHPKLKELHVKFYPGHTFSDWIGNPTSCASLESIILKNCQFITFLPFGDLYKLKYLKVAWCSSLQFIQEESLPLLLEEMEITHCESLIFVSGIKRLKSLVKVHITNCSKLLCLDRFWDLKTCKIDISLCPKLRKWCLQHDVIYNEDLISAEELDSDLEVLKISDYNGRTFPDCFGDATYCGFLKRIELYSCKFIQVLPFGGLCKLNYLEIKNCSSLQLINEESLPLLLEEIKISNCDNLISVTGIQRLNSLVRLEIADCMNLCTLDPSRKEGCIYVSRCPKLRELCLRRHIEYSLQEEKLRPKPPNLSDSRKKLRPKYLLVDDEFGDELSYEFDDEFGDEFSDVFGYEFVDKFSDEFGYVFDDEFLKKFDPSTSLDWMAWE
ncbi:Disease resistance protein (CC-NBS-LRR class) family [Rhynchospora pubera]|uniref:Disease resistance protein (CC-NBS-LRR class) family n=1 Tax=Rhynchospora pubera TaxID=906938 RepID=A0AAV8FDJ6_9POAL|nr:Disease resistance protein (CC-NBS-LRR class) family [Rhynchospora pubera]